MATTDRDSAKVETISPSASVEVEQAREKRSDARQAQRPALPSWWWIGVALVGVTGAGMIAGLYGVPWAANQGRHGIMMAGTWLFLVSGIVWLLASIAVIWWIAREEILSQWRWFKGLVRLSPKAHPDVVDR